MSRTLLLLGVVAAAAALCVFAEDTPAAAPAEPDVEKTPTVDEWLKLTRQQQAAVIAFMGRYGAHPWTWLSCDYCQRCMDRYIVRAAVTGCDDVAEYSRSACMVGGFGPTDPLMRNCTKDFIAGCPVLHEAGFGDRNKVLLCTKGKMCGPEIDAKKAELNAKRAAHIAAANGANVDADLPRPPVAEEPQLNKGDSAKAPAQEANADL